MDIPEEIIYEILEYTGTLPKYGRTSTIFKRAEELGRKNNMERMDKEYPLWREMSIGDDLKYEMLYSIPIFHLNRAALNKKWDDFLDIVHYHGVNIVPAALGILHLFKRFDISDKIINLYGWNPIIDASSLEKYTWWTNRYRYPILYNMWRKNYVDKAHYLIEWVNISNNPTSVIGYVTSGMIEYAKINHKFSNMRDLIRLYSIHNQSWFPI